MSEKKKENKNQQANEIAEIMVANMTANMKDPEKFWKEKERRMEDARDAVFTERRFLEKKE